MLRSRLCLQGKILIIVLRKIDCFGLFGNSLKGVVIEFSALFNIGGQSTLDAQNVTVVQKCAMSTVFAGFLNFFTKQHNWYLEN